MPLRSGARLTKSRFSFVEQLPTSSVLSDKSFQTLDLEPRSSAGGAGGPVHFQFSWDGEAESGDNRTQSIEPLHAVTRPKEQSTPCPRGVAATVRHPPSNSSPASPLPFAASRCSLSPWPNYSYGLERGHWSADRSSFRYVKADDTPAIGRTYERCSFSIIGRALVLSDCRMAGRFTRMQ